MAKREREVGRGRQDLAVNNLDGDDITAGGSGSEPWESRTESNPGNESQPRRSRRGFAAMDPAQHREISRRGGQASHLSGRGHEWNEDEAREAGRRGGEARWAGRRMQRDSQQAPPAPGRAPGSERM